MSLARVACIIPARDEAQRIGATVKAAIGLPGVEIVIVCDDASSDATEQHAGAAGAVVVSHSRALGKAAALESGVNALGVLEQRDQRAEYGTLLFLDADLEAAAAQLRPLITPVTTGQADLTVAVPPSAAATPANRVVETAATRGIHELTGWTPRAPLSGQRCLTRRAFELASPLAGGWGADVGMLVDLVKAGLRVREVEIDLENRPPPSTDLPGQLRRARQLADVTRALAARGLVQAGVKDFRDSGGVQGLLNRFKR